MCIRDSHNHCIGRRFASRISFSSSVFERQTTATRRQKCIGHTPSNGLHQFGRLVLPLRLIGCESDITIMCVLSASCADRTSGHGNRVRFGVNSCLPKRIKPPSLSVTRWHRPRSNVAMKKVFGVTLQDGSPLHSFQTPMITGANHRA